MSQSARRWNRLDSAPLFYSALTLSVVLALTGGGALVAGPWTTGLDPAGSAYAATVWVLVIWTAVHVGIGVIMQLYCLARRAARILTGQYPQDVVNVTLYWHFVAITVAVTVAVIAGFPLVV